LTAEVREQVALWREYDAHVKAELGGDAAASENKSLPIHRWVPWIAGFSAQFVRDTIDEYLPGRDRTRHLVLDPFAGVATTLVEALKTGCNAIGHEINPFAVLAARAKINCIDVPLDGFKAELDAFRSSVEQFESEIDRLWLEGGGDALAGVAETLRPLNPRYFRSRIPFFSRPIEAKFLYCLGRVAALREPNRSLFQAALGATMISFSNYTYEPSLSSRPGAGKPVIDNASVDTAICRKLGEMLDDMAWAQTNYGEAWQRASRRIVHGSYFESTENGARASLLVTSPPYMNNYHYVRNTRPQLHWLGLIQEPDEIRECEQQSFGKFWQTVRQGKSVDLEFEFPELAASVRELRALNTDRGPYGGPGWANYVSTYFNDCCRFLRIARRQLRPNAHAVIVVGNSIIQGMEFKVDQLLADMAERQGMRVAGIRILRTKRVGNSIINSSVRNSPSAAHSQKTRLYDAEVILRLQ
jgi:hypothetical protein